MKDDYLRENGCFNSNHASVTADAFASSPFFDARDIVQVKYEMVRAASGGESSVTEIAEAHGFSRKSFYQAREAFDAGGLCALVPKKTGPKGPNKLNTGVQEFIFSFLKEHSGAKSGQISAALENEMGIKIHPRTIYRHIKKN